MLAYKDRIKYFLAEDMTIIAFSIVTAIILVRTDVLIKILTSTKELELLGSFIAGMFFTSAFTTIPAIVTLGEIAQADSLLMTALLGAAGAVVGDLIIFKFFRDRFSGHIMELIRHEGGTKRMKVLIKLKSFRWLTFLVGGMIIASPLPDELGIGLLGFSKMNIAWFATLSYVFNFGGIVLIGLVARAI